MRKTEKQQEMDRIFFERVVGVALLLWFLSISACGFIGLIVALLK